MPAPEALHSAFVEAAARWPDRTAVVDPGSGEVRYRELAELSDRLRDPQWLLQLTVALATETA